MAGILHQLADVLHFEILFAHLNHSLRGSDSDEDEAFVKSLGERLNVPVVCERCDVEAWAADKKISIEMAAREARHAFFAKLTREEEAHWLVLGHTQNDQEETILMKWLRGAGPRGLGGMRVVKAMEHFSILRPALTLTRDELRDWLTVQGLTWREDASNKEMTFLRNRIRHRILPFFE